MITLTDHLHDKFMSWGDNQAPARDMAEVIQDFEQYNGCEFTADDIRKAVWDAGESFVDSMIGNEYDTHYDCLDDQDEAVARWEAMRPSVRRRAAIVKMLDVV